MYHSNGCHANEVLDIYFQVTFTSNKVIFLNQVNVFIAYHLSKFIFNQKEKHGFIWPKYLIFLFQKIRFLI